jgi:transcriptional regulator of acetoin/glycerol metabolism
MTARRWGIPILDEMQRLFETLLQDRGMDPEQAGNLAVVLVAALARGFAGVCLPSMRKFEKSQTDALTVKTKDQVGGTKAAERLGVSRSTVYRREAADRDRKRNAA